jgi:hypothetical protein
MSERFDEGGWLERRPAGGYRRPVNQILRLIGVPFAFQREVGLRRLRVLSFAKATVGKAERRVNKFKVKNVK